MSCGKPHEGSDCGEVLDRVYEFLDGEMTSEDISRIRQHLIDCAPCLHEYDLDQALKALVRRSCACEPAPEGLRLKIMYKIRQVRVLGEH